MWRCTSHQSWINIARSHRGRNHEINIQQSCSSSKDHIQHGAIQRSVLCRALELVVWVIKNLGFCLKSPKFMFLGCVECMRCRLLLLMFVVSVCQCLSVLSHGSTQLHCAKTAEQIKVPLGVNTLGDPRNSVLERGPNPTTERRRGVQCSIHM